MTQIEALTRLVDWFCDQNELIQASVLGQLSEITQADPAEQLLRQMTHQRSEEETEAMAE